MEISYIHELCLQKVFNFSHVWKCEQYAFFSRRVPSDMFILFNHHLFKYASESLCTLQRLLNYKPAPGAKNLSWKTWMFRNIHFYVVQADIRINYKMENEMFQFFKFVVVQVDFRINWKNLRHFLKYFFHSYVVQVNIRINRKMENEIFRKYLVCVLL